MIFFIPMRSDTTLRSLDNTDFPIDSVFQILSQTPNLTCGYVCEGGQGRTKIKKSFPLRPTSTRGLWLDITLPNFFNGHGWGIYDHNCSDALDRCSKRTPTLLSNSPNARRGSYSRRKRDLITHTQACIEKLATAKEIFCVKIPVVLSKNICAYPPYNNL